MPAKVYLPSPPHGDFRAMPARGDGYALLKWVTSFPGNPARGLPTVTGARVRPSCRSDAEHGVAGGARGGYGHRAAHRCGSRSRGSRRRSRRRARSAVEPDRLAPSSRRRRPRGAPSTTCHVPSCRRAAASAGVRSETSVVIAGEVVCGPAAAGGRRVHRRRPCVGADRVGDAGEPRVADASEELAVDAARPQRAAVDEAGVGLHERRAGADALPGVVGGLDAADGDQRRACRPTRARSRRSTASERALSGAPERPPAPAVGVGAGSRSGRGRSWCSSR